MRNYALVACGLVLAAQAHAQAGATLTVVPERPVVGKDILLKYTPPAGTPTTLPVQGRLYLYDNFAWRTDSLVLLPVAGGWQATYRVPATCAFAALRFYQGAARDTATGAARPGFYFVTRDKKGRKLPGGAIGEAIFRRPFLDTQLPAAFPTPAQPAPPEVLGALLREELARKDAAPTQFVRPYLALQRVLLGSAYSQQSAAVLAPLLQAPLPTTEADLMALQGVAKYELKDAKKAAELTDYLVQKYPKGEFRRLTAYSALRDVAPAGRLASLENFLTAFPESELPPAHRQHYIYYETYRLLAASYFEAGNYSKLLALRPRWDFKTENEVYRWNITRAYLFKTVSPDSLYRVATGLMQDLLAKEPDGSYLEPGVFDREQARAAARKELDERLGIQIALLADLRKYDEALGYFDQLSAKAKYADASLNEKHLRMLDAQGKKAEALALLESSGRANALTPAMLTRLQQAYQASHGSLAGYDKYLAALRSGEEVAAMHAYVQQHLVDMDYTPFGLEDASGATVRSSDWEGKVVVLDFWATWCGPCIRAFPGMQLLVDKYAHDARVDFYFVGTMQEGNYKEKDINYLKQQGYRFKLLLDAERPKTHEQDAVFRTFAPLFQSSGIPRKVILKDGRIRYTSEGYSGSPSQLADELSYAIELLKKS